MSKHPDIKAHSGKQISVFIENEPGTLGEVTQLLGAQGINIYALTLTGGLDHGYVRMVVDRHEQAMSILKDAGQLIFERDVVLLEIPNKPGCLAIAAQQWAQDGINLEYAYCAGGPSVENGLVVVRVDDTERAVAVLQ